jgi:biopolymer transport protein ExbD
MRFRPHNFEQREKLPRLPLAAFIDVCLFLLLYFMLASDLSKPESWLDSTIASDKKGPAQAADLQPQVVTVGVEKDQPVFRLGDRVTTDKASLESVLKQLPKQNGVFIKVPGEVPVWAAAMAIQAARDSGFIKVSYVPAK